VPPLYPAAAPSVRWAAAGVFALFSVLRLVPEWVLAGR
jgi:hypothetical protein